MINDNEEIPDNIEGSVTALDIYHKVKSDECSYLTEDNWETGKEVFCPASLVKKNFVKKEDVIRQITIYFAKESNNPYYYDGKISCDAKEELLDSLSLSKE